MGDGGGKLNGVLMKNVSAIWLINGENVLQNVDLDTRSQSGNFVGITGAVGSGKVYFELLTASLKFKYI